MATGDSHKTWLTFRLFEDGGPCEMVLIAIHARENYRFQPRDYLFPRKTYLLKRFQCTLRDIWIYHPKNDQPLLQEIVWFVYKPDTEEDVTPKVYWFELISDLTTLSDEEVLEWNKTVSHHGIPYV